MASSYSSTLNLELQASGENSGTWGTITNNNLQKLESAAKGYVSVAVASTTDSLTATDGSTTDEQSNAIIKLTGTLSGATTMSTEAVETWYIVDDATTHSGNTLTFKPSGGTGTTLVQGAKHILYSDGSTMFDVLNDAGNIKANGTLTVSGNTSLDGGSFVFNESSADLDFRIEGNGDANLFFTDAGNDRIGIKTNSPADALVEINQANSSGAIACLSLDQDDQDQEFIKFDGTTGSGSTASVSTSTATDGSKVGALKINVNGTDRYIRFYDSAI